MTDVARTLRAMAEVLVPGREAGDRADGAPEIAAETFIAHYLEFVLPGLAAQVCALLDAQGEGTFASLPLERRTQVLDGLADHEAAPMRAIADLLVALAACAVYGEWSGLDAGGELVRAPLGWELSGWIGPVRARPDLLPGA